MNKAYQRLKDLGEYVSKFDDVLCLLGLGSMADLNRMDQYSDMDFFLIVKNGTKQGFIKDLSWLEVAPLVYIFRNTVDGYKVLFEDEVFGEFAVFEEGEMKNAYFSKGKSIYHKSNFDLTVIEPKHEPKIKDIDKDYYVNEAMTNLYIGLLREKRGEKSSAMTFIQVHAFQLIIGLFQFVFTKTDTNIDPYVFERRIEKRFVDAKKLISDLRQGYQRNKESAKTAIDFLKTHFDCNESMVRSIETLL